MTSTKRHWMLHISSKTHATLMSGVHRSQSTAVHLRDDQVWQKQTRWCVEAFRWLTPRDCIGTWMSIKIVNTCFNMGLHVPHSSAEAAGGGKISKHSQSIEVCIRNVSCLPDTHVRPLQTVHESKRASEYLKARYTPSDAFKTCIFELPTLNDEIKMMYTQVCYIPAHEVYQVVQVIAR
jgi:hypothetical protein